MSSPADLGATDFVASGKRGGIVARLLYGTGAGAVAYALGILTNLLLLPLYLRRWSVAEYGEWMTLYSLVNYLSNLDFGVTTAATNAAAGSFARKDLITFKRIQGTAWVSSLVLAAAGAAIVFATMLFGFHLIGWLRVTVLTRMEARMVFCGLSFSLLATIPGRQLSAAYIAIGDYAKYQWLQNGSFLASFMMTGIALFMGARPASLAWMNAGTSLLTVAATYGITKMRDPWLIPHLRDGNWKTARNLAMPTGQFGLQLLASALTLQGPVLLLSRAMGGPAVALFTTTRTVANVVRGTLILLRAPLRPEFAAIAARSSKEALRRLFRLAVSLDALLAITLSAGLWSVGGWLIGFWSHGRILPDGRLLHLLLVFFTLEGFLMMLSGIGSATNRLHGVSLAQVIAASLSLALTGLLIPRFGTSAIPLGGFLPLLSVLLPITIWNASRETALSATNIICRVFFPFIAAGVAAAAMTSQITRMSRPSVWVSGITSSLCACVLSAAVMLFFVLTETDRKDLRNLWARMPNRTAAALAVSGEKSVR